MCRSCRLRPGSMRSLRCSRPLPVLPSGRMPASRAWSGCRTALALGCRCSAIAGMRRERAVTGPLAEITRVADGGGSAMPTVPHVGRHDEVGALARSIGIFQQAMRRNADSIAPWRTDQGREARNTHIENAVDRSASRPSRRSARRAQRRHHAHHRADADRRRLQGRGPDRAGGPRDPTTRRATSTTSLRPRKNSPPRSRRSRATSCRRRPLCGRPARRQNPPTPRSRASPPPASASARSSI